MGEVYRARDTRLGREVAIKVLPSSFSSDAERLRRFEQEARAAGMLNHPNIVAIYDVGTHEGAPYVVTELLEGETLRARLAGGALPQRKAIEYALQIARGLAAAHEKGIVHRDLKPENLFVTKDGRVKILDFGLAKLADSRARTAAAAAGGEEGETEVAPVAARTQPGVVLGTVGYMSPEQVRGKAADHRADIFSFGAILYEMVAGRRAFQRDTAAETMTAILNEEPPELPPTALVPPALDGIVRHCLEKVPEERFHSAHDLAFALESLTKVSDSAIREAAASSTRLRDAPWLRAVAIIAAVLSLAVLGSTALWRIRAPRHPSPVMRADVLVSRWGLTLAKGGVAISPDGQTVVFTAQRGGEPLLYVRRFDEWEPRALPGTERASTPFFSFDGEWVAFAVTGKGIQKVPVRGGPPQSICAVERSVYGGTWGSDGRIIFGQWPNAGLWSVSAEGGTPQPLVRPAETSGVEFYMSPQLLPGGAGLIFTIGRGGHTSIAALSFRTGDVRPLIDSGSDGRCLPTGHLIYRSEGHLRAIGFDPQRLEVRGTSRAVIENAGDYGVSLTGTLVYVPPSTSLSRLVWKDRTGKTTPLNFRLRPYCFPALSPDGRRLAVTVIEAAAVTVEEGAARNIWVGSVEGEPLARLTFGNQDAFSVFTRDGKRVLFTSGRNGRYNIFWTPTDRSGEPQRLTDSPHAQRPTSLSPGGNVLLFSTVTDSSKHDIVQMETGRPDSARPLVKTPFREMDGAFSPDGRWVAYQSDESGRFEVYVQAYPGPGTRIQVSTEGGLGPAWNPRGGELFYEAPAGVMSVRMVNGRPVGPPTKLFAFTSVAHILSRAWDVSPDGQRFLAVEPAEAGTASSQLNIVSNWFEELKARVPAGKQ
jgi:Tol biopolymer transport system component